MCHLFLNCSLPGYIWSSKGFAILPWDTFYQLLMCNSHCLTGIDSSDFQRDLEQHLSPLIPFSEVVSYICNVTICISWEFSNLLNGIFKKLACLNFRSVSCTVQWDLTNAYNFVSTITV